LALTILRTLICHSDFNFSIIFPVQVKKSDSLNE